jgi:predicted RNA-binding protein
MLTPFGTDIWIAKGPILSTAGFTYPTRCAIMRLSDGNLVVWSPVTLTDDLKNAVDALGPVKALIAPNSFHHLFFKDWADAYPHAKCFAAPRLAKKRADIAFDATLTDMADVIWVGELAQVIVRGNILTDEVVFFHKASGTVVFTDILQQFDKGWFTGWRGSVARLDLMEGTEPQVLRKFRLAFRNRKAAQASIKTILGWPTQQVLMAHGRPVTKDANGFLKRAFSWLMT